MIIAKLSLEKGIRQLYNPQNSGSAVAKDRGGDFKETNLQEVI